MKQQADGFFLPENAQSTRPENAYLSGINADRLHQEETDSIRLHGQARKPFDHADLVTAVTDGHNLTLVTCSYSAGSFFEFATSSSSGEIQVDSCPSLNRANFPGRSPELKELDFAKKDSQHWAHREQNLLESIQSSKHCVLIHSSTYLRTATSAFQVYLLPAANALNQQPQPSC